MTQPAIVLDSSCRVPQAELIARVLAGDHVAARDLYDAHVERVYRLTYRLTGDAELASEFTQDTFIRAFHRLADFRGDAALSTWLHSIALSVVANGLRKIRRLHGRETELDASHGSARDHVFVDHVLRSRLHRAIDALPEIYRVTVVMHDIEGYTHTEIGEILGVAEGTCKSRLSAARARLRMALADVMEELRS